LRLQGEWGKTSPRGFEVEQGSVEVVIEVEEIVEYTSEEDNSPEKEQTPTGGESQAMENKRETLKGSSS
jgi:hypothetical protein